MPQIDIPWEKAPAKPSSKGSVEYLVNSACANFRWLEQDDDAALRRAEELAKYRRSTTVIYRGEQRLAAFNPTGKRFL